MEEAQTLPDFAVPLNAREENAEENKLMMVIKIFTWQRLV